MIVTDAQKAVIKANGLKDRLDFVEWIGTTALFHFEGRYALVNEHGSITYCDEAMLEAHKAGIPQ